MIHFIVTKFPMIHNLLYQILLILACNMVPFHFSTHLSPSIVRRHASGSKCGLGETCLAPWRSAARVPMAHPKVW